MLLAENENLPNLPIHSFMKLFLEYVLVLFLFTVIALV